MTRQGNTLEIENINLQTNERRKELIIRNTWYIIFVYIFAIILHIVAKMNQLTSINSMHFAVLAATGILSCIFFICITKNKKQITIRFSNFVFFSMYLVWMITYTIWVLLINEIRSITLLVALIALLFMITKLNFIQALMVSITATFMEAIATYIAINHLHQQGSLVKELFFIGCFLPSAILLSYLADKLTRHNKEIIEAKREAEKMRDQLWGEMELAKKIQTILLPKELVIKGYDISAYMKPASDVGGDYYDIITFGERNWIVIGDVSGHGLHSGLVMMMAQSSIRTALYGNPGQQPSELLSQVNKTIRWNIKTMGENKFMTITAFSFDNNGTISYSGRHDYFMVYRSASRKVELIKPVGIILGCDLPLREDLNATLRLDCGDVLILYTDGITEARRSDSVEQGTGREMFGEHRLQKVFETYGEGSAEEIKMKILQSLDGFECIDDVTLLVIKRKT
jgi:serine phosphatase RsbU (regulator of sigma subunit)